MNLKFIKENLPGVIFCFFFGIVIYLLFENFNIKFIDTLLSGLLVGVLIKNLKFLPDLSILDK